jgi:hypothetical protein
VAGFGEQRGDRCGGCAIVRAAIEMDLHTQSLAFPEGAAVGSPSFGALS